MTVRTRIAPSPTGIAHVGTLYTALLNFAYAKKNGGKFILRIEDTDRERYVPGSEQVIFSALRWAGIPHDEGSDIGGPFEPYTQSQRLEKYTQYANQLIENGKAYHCFCSSERLAAMRKTQQEKGELPMYDGLCRKMSQSQSESRAKTEKFVIRLIAPDSGNTSWIDAVRGTITIENKTIDDQVLVKSDGFPTYHLAVVVDDHLMEISHVIRAEEWISSTPKHILLYKAFGFKLPVFAHTPLLRNPDKSKLSKRRNPVSVLWYQEQGFLPEALVNYLCLMGWSHPDGKDIFSLEEFIKLFSLDRVQTSQPIFDLEKLRWLNGSYIRQKSDADLLNLLKPFVPKSAKKQELIGIIALIRDRIKTLNEFSEYADFFFQAPKVDSQILLKQSKLEAEKTGMKLLEYARVLEGLSDTDWKMPNLERAGRQLLDDRWSPKQLFMSVRVALTGKTVSPPLFDSMEILGKAQSIKRLTRAAEILTHNHI